jgi:hypothetical protein
VTNDAVSQLLGLHRDEELEHSPARFLSATETRAFVAAICREPVERGVTPNIRLEPRSASGHAIPTGLNAAARAIARCTYAHSARRLARSPQQSDVGSSPLSCSCAERPARAMD